MTGRQYTYEMAYNMSKQFGSALIRMGAKKGDVLAMVVPNIPEFCIAFFGACGVGVTLTTMNPTYKPGTQISINTLHYNINCWHNHYHTRNILFIVSTQLLYFRGNCSTI